MTPISLQSRHLVLGVDRVLVAPETDNLTSEKLGFEGDEKSHRPQF
jgi:hypothetical protein